MESKDRRTNPEKGSFSTPGVKKKILFLQLWFPSRKYNILNGTWNVFGDLSLLLELLSYSKIPFAGANIFRREEEIKKSANTRQSHELNLRKVNWCSLSGVAGGEGGGKCEAEGSKRRGPETESKWFHRSRNPACLVQRRIPRAYTAPAT